MEDWKYTVVPGRGLVTKSAIEYRKTYLNEMGFEIDKIEKTLFSHADVQNNIESLIGSIEIPCGIVGPLRFNNKGKFEDVFCVGATIEGALIASMNRGAKAISMSGGFTAEVIHQKMIRSPLFILSTDKSALEFENWLTDNFEHIKEVTESYSNHATLLEITVDRSGVNVHTNFVYSTGDAAGQNMTTTCTWHGILMLVKKFAADGFENIQDYVLDGNGSSDKKVSQFLIDHGRGIKVVAKAILDTEICKKILRTSPDKLLKFYTPSRSYAIERGMVGYTINAANAIAAIFAATGQDLASVHESSVAELVLKKHPRGLEISITLYSLVIGSVGGGTRLPKQNEALRIMGCYGENKVGRFASLIAGFALGLDLSTYAAIVSGEFAKAHEKLGRNKPVDWLQLKELDKDFIQPIITNTILEPIEKITVLKGEVDNGILMNISRRVNRKLMGFIPLNIKTATKNIPVLIKSKGTDKEVIKGLHLMAASINPSLSDLIFKYKDALEYKNCHKKELFIPRFLADNNCKAIPAYFGIMADDNREIYLLFQERLIKDEMDLMDSENSPKLWTESHVFKTIKEINKIHKLYPIAIGLKTEKSESINLVAFDIKKAIPLYAKIIEIIQAEDKSGKFDILSDYLVALDKNEKVFKQSKTLVHNDFSPRNIAVRKNGSIAIYDWELAVLNYPQRDIVELLSFTLNSYFTKDELFSFIKYYFNLSAENDWIEWLEISILCIKEYLVTRISFYAAAEILMKLKFVDRVYQNGIRMIKFMEDERAKG